MITQRFVGGKQVGNNSVDSSSERLDECIDKGQIFRTNHSDASRWVNQRKGIRKSGDVRNYSKSIVFYSGGNKVNLRPKIITAGDYEI